MKKLQEIVRGDGLKAMGLSQKLCTPVARQVGDKRIEAPSTKCGLWRIMSFTDVAFYNSNNIYAVDLENHAPSQTI